MKLPDSIRDAFISILSAVRTNNNVPRALENIFIKELGPVGVEILPAEIIPFVYSKRYHEWLLRWLEWRFWVLSIVSKYSLRWAPRYEFLCNYSPQDRDYSVLITKMLKYTEPAIELTNLYLHFCRKFNNYIVLNTFKSLVKMADLYSLPLSQRHREFWEILKIVSYFAKKQTYPKAALYFYQSGKTIDVKDPKCIGFDEYGYPVDETGRKHSIFENHIMLEVE